jgi:hypothetical protein
MRDHRNKLVAAIAALATVLAAAGCDSPESQPSPSPTHGAASRPSPVVTAVVPSNVDVRIRPAKGPLSERQQQVMTAFSEFVNARNRFYSHPWIIDPIYARIVLPRAPYDPLATDTVGLIGPVIVQILSVEATTATQAEVSYCVDDRAVRYLGQDGTVDIPGPAGDRRKGDVTLEDTKFTLTTDAAVDGATSATPRWLVSSSGLVAGAKECQGLINSPPPVAPTQGPVTTTP